MMPGGYAALPCPHQRTCSPYSLPCAPVCLFRHLPMSCFPDQRCMPFRPPSPACPWRGSPGGIEIAKNKVRGGTYSVERSEGEVKSPLRLAVLRGKFVAGWRGGAWAITGRCLSAGLKDHERPLPRYSLRLSSWGRDPPGVVRLCKPHSTLDIAFGTVVAGSGTQATWVSGMITRDWGRRRPGRACLGRGSVAANRGAGHRGEAPQHPCRGESQSPDGEESLSMS